MGTIETQAVVLTSIPACPGCFFSPSKREGTAEDVEYEMQAACETTLPYSSAN